MNIRFYIILIIISGLIFTKPLAAQRSAKFTKPVAAQPYAKMESRLIFTKPGAAQSYLNLDVAQVFSTFKFSTKIENPDITSANNSAYSPISVTAFSISYQSTKPKGLFILVGIGMRKAGSTLVFNNINATWNMQYADIKAGIGYQFNKFPVKPYASVVPYYAYLLDAKQSIGTNFYDIKASKSLKNNDFGLFMGLGFKAALSPYISLYSECNYILGLRNIETANDQYLYNRGFSFKLGIALSLTKFVTGKEDMVKAPTNSVADNPARAFVVEIPSNMITPSTIPVTEPPAATNISASINDNTTESLPITNADITEVLVTESKPERVNENLEPSEIKPSVSAKRPPVDKKASNIGLSETIKSSATTNNKLEKKPSSPNPMPTKIVFKIQITAVKKPLLMNHPLLENLTGKIERENGTDGKIRYYIGSFKKYEEARAELNKIKAKGGNEGAFVVAFKNGKQITVYEAKNFVE